MLCPRSVLLMLGAATLSPFIAVTTPASAETTQSCAYQLSAPQLTTTPGDAVMITATVKPTHCTGTWQPSVLSVCVTADTGGGACATGFGWDGAQVFMPPAATEHAYTATGNSCANSGVTETACVQSGPAKATM